MNLLTHTWHWSVAGFLIAVVMLLLNYFGKVFGMSSNLRSLCAMTGVGKKVPFFDWDWKSQRWNLVVVVGAMIGGYVAVNFLSDVSNVNINPKTIQQLSAMGIDAPNGKLLPDTLFGNQIFESPKMIVILLIGGLLIGLIQGLNDGLPYAFGQQWSQSVVFTILIIILVFRPAGLLGKAVTEKV